MKCIVTGGCGFIGSHLVDRLLELGNEVIVIDNLETSTGENLEMNRINPKLKVVHMSICDDKLVNFFDGCDVVFHLAALPKVRFSLVYPKETNKTNVEGVLNVLESVKKAGIKRFVYASSSSVYGDPDKLPLVEDMDTNPKSPYALQKLMGEWYCKLYGTNHKIESVCLRYFNVYGPRQSMSTDYGFLIPKSIALVFEGKNPEIYGDGKQTRDFVYVKDIVEATILAAKVKTKMFADIINVGGGNNLSVNHVINEICTGTDIKPVYLPPAVEPMNTLADISKAKKILGWTPKYTFEEGIRETIEWFSKNKK